MEWIMLLLAGGSEITWAMAMKASEGFSKVIPTVVTVVFYVASAVFLALALKKLPPWNGLCLVDRHGNHRDNALWRAHVSRSPGSGPDHLRHHDCLRNCRVEATGKLKKLKN